MLRYYPSFKIIENQNTLGGEFLLDGKRYSGRYYITYDGKAFTGSSPIVGPNELLSRDLEYAYKNNATNPNILSVIDTKKREKFDEHSKKRIIGKPNSYYPQPAESDYKKGYLIRYFTKKENQKGFVIEISPEEYNSIIDGIADYDISIYQTVQILWKITGPLKNKRTSQYNTTAGIIDTNERLVESANKTFLGIKEFIGGDYTKFARPTM
jgi:hypothetical protein